MNLVSVIPFLKSLSTEALTYFSAKKISVGDIVTITVRKKSVQGLVVGVEHVSTQKGDVKDATFQFRKLESVRGPSFFKKSFLSTLETLKDYYITETGALINSLTPKILFEHYNLLQTPDFESKKVHIEREALLFQAPLEDRLALYKSFIRERFAKNESVVFCFPTISEATFFYESLQKGIEQYAHLLHGDLATKKTIRSYNDSLNHIHPVVIFCTPAFLCIPRYDVGIYIIEHESSSAYQLIQKPHLDIRHFLEQYASTDNADVLYADTLLRTETLIRKEWGELGEFQPTNWRFPEKEFDEIIDMCTEENKKSPILSEAIKEVLRNNQRNGKKTFLFTSRKGYASTTICNDCGTTVTLHGKPLLLREDRTTGERFFQEADTGVRHSAQRTCDTCKSWNLVPLGIAVDRVAEELRTFLPPESIFLIDSTHTPTKKLLEKTAHDFKTTPGSVLVGTERALPVLDLQLDTIAVTSFDSLLNIPSTAAYHKIMYLFFLLYARTEHPLFIQTRHADETFLKILQEKNLKGWYEHDKDLRKTYAYPPFTTFLSIRYRASYTETPRVLSYLKTTYGDYSPLIREEPIKNGTTVTMILKQEHAEWDPGSHQRKPHVRKDLLEKLRLLPPYWNIAINPDRF